MSKQLAISAVFSVLAMAAFALSTAPQSLGGQTDAGAAAFAPAPAYAAAAGLPGVSN